MMDEINPAAVVNLLERALQARTAWLPGDAGSSQPFSAYRLFNGFLEGCPSLVADIYARTLVLYNFANPPLAGQPAAAAAQQFLLERLPWLRSVVLKTRHAETEQERRGILAYGQPPDRKAREGGIWYALDLTLNLDASLYLDTRLLRAWATERLAGKRVLNTFAYTGSLGVAAAAGGAREVIHIDLNRRFLNLGKDSYALNGIPVRRADFRSADFWSAASQLIRAGELFDCVIVDPPFFSQTGRGRVDLVAESSRVINKVRPLVGHNGCLVAINNALFVSGAQYEAQLQALCADGYLTLEARIPVPPDVAGFTETRAGDLPADPAPYNYATKIAVLRARRKDERAAGS